jgi:S-formylglutathione hydrolase
MSTILKSHRSFGGTVRFHEHDSKATKTKMRFSTFTPDGELLGAVIWLSGLTCTEENFMAKAGAQRALAAAGVMVICPDTSPRGLNLPGEHDADDFGSGAGFYVDATTPGYSDHYRMYSYVTRELYGLLENDFGCRGRISIMGHSMGGHGALVMGLREPDKFRSVSAFAPIAHPSACGWGVKAFTGYLGSETDSWAAYDTCEILSKGFTHKQKILIDQGTADPFIEKQLLPSHLVEAAKVAGQELDLRYQEGYDHSYYGIATLIDDHVRFHAQHLLLAQK